MARRLTPQPPFGYGELPNDGREWCTLQAVADRIGIKPCSVLVRIKTLGWTTYRKRPYGRWILKQDVDSDIRFEELRRRWYKNHRPKTWHEEVCTTVDEATARRVFWTSAQAGLFMGVTARTISQWGLKGKIPVFVTGKHGRGRRVWYSPSSLRHLKEDEAYLKGKERYQKTLDTIRAGIVGRQVYKLTRKPCVYRKPIPPGWLTTRQVAERLDLSCSAVHTLRRKGRLFAKQYIKGKLEDTRNWMVPEWTRNRHWFFPENEVEEYRNNEDKKQQRELRQHLIRMTAQRKRP
jgi:hypothetical protein